MPSFQATQPVFSGIHNGEILTKEAMIQWLVAHREKIASKSPLAIDRGDLDATSDTFVMEYDVDNLDVFFFSCGYLNII